MRRLPVFLMIDVSESMVGESLTQLDLALGAITSMLQRDPYAIETAYVSVIVFAGRPRTLTPLVAIDSFRPPRLEIGGGTALGGAMMHLMNEIDNQVKATSRESKGDWRPLVFLLTDGQPTDDVAPAAERWNDLYRSRTQLVAVSIGNGASLEALRRFTEDVVMFDDSPPDAFVRFAKWLSLSIQAQSRSVAFGSDAKVNLDKADRDVLTPAPVLASSDGRPNLDERYAVLVGRCASRKLPYLIKFRAYDEHQDSTEVMDAELARTRPYIYESVAALQESYFELTDPVRRSELINTALLLGQPPCPHCEVPYTMARCGDCGGILCVSGVGQRVCPWCESVGYYELSDEEFDVTRGEG